MATDDPAAAVEAYRPLSFGRRLATLRAVDPHFAATWLAHVASIVTRPRLDRRKRLLVLVGQYTMLRDCPALEDTLEAGVRAGIEPRELVEVILQTYVYAGDATTSDAVEACSAVMDRHGLLEGLAVSGPSAEATRTERSLDHERTTWSREDAADPRLGGLLERYGWYGLSTGLRLRPGHHLDIVSTLDLLDPDFLQAWLDSVYEGMYSRGVLDDATRLLCVVGMCLAVGETHQGVNHMRGALRQGVAAHELLEVILLSTVTAGHPRMLRTIDEFVTLLDGEGRLQELVGPERIAELRGMVAARGAKRH